MSKQDAIHKQNQFFKNAESRGANVLSFNCLGCGFSVKTLAPEIEGATWDSMTFCPNCDKAYFKIVTHNQVEVEML